EVDAYIKRNPDVMNCLGKGVINLSALSRQIMKDLKISNFNAVEAALKRISVTSEEKNYEDVLSKSSIETYTNVSVFIMKPKNENLKLAINIIDKMMMNYSRFRIIQGIQGAAVVTNDNEAEKILRLIPKGEIVEIYRGVSEIAITSPISITFTRGYVAHISSLLAGNGINVMQIVSFYTDVTYILSIEDMPKAFQVIMNEISRINAKK
ncbi:MAG: ACT domain-containing protein, partial [Thermoplasmata archaeon]